MGGPNGMPHGFGSGYTMQRGDGLWARRLADARPAYQPEVRGRKGWARLARLARQRDSEISSHVGILHAASGSWPISPSARRRPKLMSGPAPLLPVRADSWAVGDGFGPNGMPHGFGNGYAMQRGDGLWARRLADARPAYQPEVRGRKGWARLARLARQRDSEIGSHIGILHAASAAGPLALRRKRTIVS